jgi:hypothetical protein
MRRNRASRGLTARNQGLKHNYAYKAKVYAQKVNSRISGGISREIKGLNEENRT